MKRFLVTVPISGEATYEVFAESKEEALVLFDQGEHGRLTDYHFDNDLEPQELPHIDEV